MDDYINSIKVSRDMHKNYNGIYLTDAEANVLKNNGVDIKKYGSIKELMFDLEEMLYEETDEELERVLESISEFNYYHNTNK